VPVTGPGPRHAGTGPGETGAAVTHPPGRLTPGEIVEDLQAALDQFAEIAGSLAPADTTAE
jgi:hypothetical protein